MSFCSSAHHCKSLALIVTRIIQHQTANSESMGFGSFRNPYTTTPGKENQGPEKLPSLLPGKACGACIGSTQLLGRFGAGFSQPIGSNPLEDRQRIGDENL